jgi:hypothetical protein
MFTTHFDLVMWMYVQNFEQLSICFNNESMPTFKDFIHKKIFSVEQQK